MLASPLPRTVFVQHKVKLQVHFPRGPGKGGAGHWVVSDSPPCRFMVKLAEETDGIIVTNEQLHILMNSSKKLMVKDR